MRTFATLASALAVISVASAQTSTDCDPTKKECPNNPGLNQADYSVDFSKGLPKDWTATTGKIDGTPDGGRFRINGLGEGPTVQSNWYFFYGRVEAKVKAAPGQGIISSIVLQSSDLDEIDWEWVGSETTRAQSNYFGKGNTTTYDRGGFHNVNAPADTWHTYAIDWTKDAITWYIDNNPVRTLKYNEANGGHTFPQTPVNIRLGNWIAGTPGNSPGTIEWAGGLVDLNKKPFDMYISSLTLKNYNPGTAYKYGDRSGSTGSIQIIRTGGETSTIPGNTETGTVDSGSKDSSSTDTNSGNAVGGENHSNSNSNANSQGSESQAPGSTPTSLVVRPSGSAVASVSVPANRVQTPTPASASSSTSTPAVVLSNGAADLKVHGLGAGLLAVFGLFMAL